MTAAIGRNEVRACFIFGAGPQGRLTAEAAERTGWFRRIVFLDNGARAVTVDGVPIIRSDVPTLEERENAFLYIALGNPVVRRRVADDLALGGYRLGSALIDPSAYVSKYADLGAGSVVLQNAHVENGVRTGANVIINSSAFVGHDVVLRYDATISPRAVIGGRVDIGARTFVGLGAQIMPRVEVGDDSFVGASSLVLKNVPDNSLVYGVPAEVRGKVDEHFDWKKVL